jgi:hypothetical protein
MFLTIPCSVSFLLKLSMSMEKVPFLQVCGLMKDPGRPFPKTNC